MRQLIGLVFLVLFAAQSAQAQSQTHTYSGIADADSLTIIDDVAFEFDVQLTLGQLMREPVVSSRFRWLIDVPNSRATIPAMGIGDSRYEEVPLAGLGSQAPGKVRIYDVKIEYQLSTPAGTLYLLSDAGDPAPGDGRKWSFNVPGSPNWAQMFYRSPIQTVNGSRSFVSAQTAKQAMNNVRLVHARVLDAQISFYDLHNWYMRRTDAAEAIATERAIEPLRIALYRNFGYEVPGVSGAFFPPSTALSSVRSGIGTLPSIMSGYLDRAGPRLAKLMTVPKELHTSENAAIYNDAVRAARSTIAHFRRRAAAYSSPDKDPRSFRQGREGRFGGSYAVQQIEGEEWIVDTTNGNTKVRRLGSDERLIGTSYYIHRAEVDAVCQGNRLIIPLLDPASKTAINGIELPCPINGLSISGVSFSSLGDMGHPFLTVDVRRSKPRKVRKSYTCSSCGHKTKRRETVNQIDFTKYRINSDLSVQKVKDFTWTASVIGCGLTLCRN